MRKGVALYTGGKDSHYALIEASKEGIHVDLLLVVVPAVDESWMFHTVNVRLSQLHANLMSFGELVVQVSGVKEREVREVISSLKGMNLSAKYDYIVSGAVASKYQKERVDLIAEELGLKHVAPLWGRNQEALLREEVRSLSFIVTAIQAYGLSFKWLGNVVNEERLKYFLDDIRRASISPVGEGGEFETFVVTSRLFRGGMLYINSTDLVTYPQHGLGYCYIRKATVIPVGVGTEA